MDGLSFDLPALGAVLLRGDNGSGKTTLLNVLSGMLRPDQGALHACLGGRHWNLLRMSPERIARSGVGRLWQDIRLFPTMTVMENVLAATPGLAGLNPLQALLARGKVNRQERIAREQALYNLELVGMADRSKSTGERLSLGQMKRVAIARLLQSGSLLMLLDEPLAGLDHRAADDLLCLLEDLNRRQGKTLLIVEHQHERVRGLCGETWYLSDGKVISDGGRQ